MPEDVKVDFSHCTLIGDKGHLSASLQLDFSETAHIRKEVPSRSNQKDWKPFFPPFGRFWKRIETGFSQLADPFIFLSNINSINIVNILVIVEIHDRKSHNGISSHVWIPLECLLGGNILWILNKFQAMNQL